MRRHSTLILPLLFGLMFATHPAKAVWVYANGGNYFTAEGPTQNWRTTTNEGFCGKYGKWCSPANVQWTYSAKGSVFPVNSARWNIEPKQLVRSRAYAFVPRRDATTGNAPYSVAFGFVSNTRVYINQMAYSDQWVPLTSASGLPRISSVELMDNTDETTYTRIAFDEIKIET